jgi:glucose/mannose-6-phosphate isomerase
MAHRLDDRAFVLRLDPKGMYDLAVDFPDQCRRALEIARKSDVSFPGWSPREVVLSGLGGSAIGGDVARSIVELQGTVPFIVNRDYHLPGFVGESTLVIAASYSGNTEETLSSYRDAVKRGAKVLAVTSGGTLREWAERDGFPCIVIPGGQPPRTALGYMLVPVLYACEALGICETQDFESAIARLDAGVSSWGIETSIEENPAKQLAEVLHGRVSVIYGLGSWQAVVANRWKGQINENGKNMTFANVFPELNHNEILGWVKSGEQGVDQWIALFLEDGNESAKMKTRAEVTARLIEPFAEVLRIQLSGETLLETMLAFIYLGDFVSLYLAALNEVDPENIDAINTLKSELSKVE